MIAEISGIKGWEMILQGRRAGVAILMSDKMDFKPNLIIKNRKEHFIIIKEKKTASNIAIIDISSPNTGRLNFI